MNQAGTVVCTVGFVKRLVVLRSMWAGRSEHPSMFLWRVWPRRRAI